MYKGNGDIACDGYHKYKVSVDNKEYMCGQCASYT